jgi:hypothetical protein
LRQRRNQHALRYDRWPQYFQCSCGSGWMGNVCVSCVSAIAFSPRPATKK